MTSPRTYYKEDLMRFLEFLKKHNGNITHAARSAGIVGGRKKVLELALELPWFKEGMENVLDEIFDSIEGFVIKKSKSKLTAAKFMLQNHKKGRERGYGKRHEITGKDGADLTWADMVHQADMEKSKKKEKK